MAHMEKTASPTNVELYNKYIAPKAKSSSPEAPKAPSAPPKPSTGAAAPNYVDRIGWMADTAVNNGLASKTWGTQLRRKAVLGMNKARQNIRPETERGLFTSNMFINPKEFDDYKRRFDIVRQDPWVNPDETAEVFGYMEKAMPEEEFRNATSAIKWSLPTSIAAGATGDLFGAQSALDRQQQSAENYIGDGAEMTLMHLSNLGGEALGAYYGGKAMGAAGSAAGKLEATVVPKVLPNAGKAMRWVAGTPFRAVQYAGSPTAWRMSIGGHVLDEAGRIMGPAVDENGELTTAGYMQLGGQMFRNMPQGFAYGAVIPGMDMVNPVARQVANTGMIAAHTVAEKSIAAVDTAMQQNSPIFSAIRGYEDVRKNEDAYLREIQAELATNEEYIAANGGPATGDALRRDAERAYADFRYTKMTEAMGSVEGTEEEKAAKRQKMREDYVTSNTIVDSRVFSDPSLTAEQRASLAQKHLEYLTTGAVGLKDTGDLVKAWWSGDTDTAKDKALEIALQRDPRVAKGVQTVMSGYMDLLSSPMSEDVESSDINLNTMRKLQSVLKGSSQEQVNSYFDRLNEYSDERIGTLLSNMSRASREGRGILTSDPKVFNALKEHINARMDNPESMAALMPVALNLASAADGGLPRQYMDVVMNKLGTMDFDKVFNGLDGDHFFDLLQVLQTQDGKGRQQLVQLYGEDRVKQLEDKVTACAKSAIGKKLIENPALFNRAAGAWLTSIGMGEAGKWANDNPGWFYGGIAALLGLGGMLLLSGDDDADDDDEAGSVAGGGGNPAYIDKSRIVNALAY